MSVGYSKGSVQKRFGPPIPGLRERLACYGWGRGREVKAVTQGGSLYDSSWGGALSHRGSCVYLYFLM